MAKEKKPIDTSPMKFELSNIAIPVTIGSNQYTMKEATAGTATMYKNMVMNGMKIGPDGRPQSMKNIAGAETFLVSRCLWDSKGKNPTVAEVELWPSRITAELFVKIKEISGMDQDDEELDEDDESKK